MTNQLAIDRRASGVAVWDYNAQTFIPFIPCHGEERVRIDVHDALENYGVFPVTYHEDDTFDFKGDANKPLDWRIDYS